MTIYEGRSRLQVLVRDNNVDQALRALKKKLQREGVFRELKLRGHYEQPSERRACEKAGGGRGRGRSRPAGPGSGSAGSCSAKGSCRQSRVRSPRPAAPGPGRRRWPVERDRRLRTSFLVPRKRHIAMVSEDDSPKNGERLKAGGVIGRVR